MKPAAAVLVTSVLCTIASCGQTSAPGEKAAPSLTYQVVSKNPAGYAGKRVTWTGTQFVTETDTDSSKKVSEVRIGFKVESGKDGIDMFAVIGKKNPEMTEAAQKLANAHVNAEGRTGFGARFKVTGTISKMTHYFRFPNGEFIEAPVLTNAIIDAPDSQTKK
jgi:hypothetical protein